MKSIIKSFSQTFHPFLLHFISLSTQSFITILCDESLPMKSIAIFLFIFLFLCADNRAQSFYQASGDAQHWVDSVFNKLSKKERIAQLMVVRLSAKTPAGVEFYSDKVEADIRKYNIGSVCLFQGSPVQQAAFINHFQSIAQTPIMFCIDDETGLGMRMDSVTKFPEQMTIGAANDSSLPYTIGKAIGKQCQRIGIQVSYAPVVDINNNANNPVINFRSLGQDKYKVASYGVQVMRGIQSENVMACAKHFPGHGDVAVDSHLDLPVINKSMAQLDSLELFPFKRMFAAGVGSVMIAHLSIPVIDSTPHLPTSLSQKNVTGLLRDELHYNGISFTDALEMKGVAKYFPQGEAAVQSLIAGNDMLCLPGDVEDCITQIIKAVRKKELNWNRIDSSVKKVLLAKYNLGLHNTTAVELSNLTPDLNTDVSQLRTETAQKAITLLQLQNKNLLSLPTNKKVAFVGFGITKNNAFADSIKSRYNADVFYASYKDSINSCDSILNAFSGKYDAVVIGLHQLSKYPSNNFGLSQTAVNLLNGLQANNNAITFLFGNPYAVKNMCDAKNLVACYEDDTIFQQQAFEVLKGNLQPQGTLPVTVCEKYPFGSGTVMK